MPLQIKQIKFIIYISQIIKKRLNISLKNNLLTILYLLNFNNENLNKSEIKDVSEAFNNTLNINIINKCL